MMRIASRVRSALSAQLYPWLVGLIQALLIETSDRLS